MKTDLDLALLERVELNSKLEELRRDYVWLREFKGELKVNREEELERITQEGNAIKKILSEMPELLSITQLDRDEPNYLRSSILLLINDYSDFLNITENLKTSQTQLLVELVVEHGKGLLLDDIAKLFALAKSGEYGEVYNRLDGQVILGWLKQYKEDRRERIMQRQQNQRSATRSTKHRDNEHHHLGKPLEMKFITGLRIDAGDSKK